MWKLIKMDFYRLFRGKAIKIGAFVAALLCVGYMLVSLLIVAIAKATMNVDPAAIVGMEFFLSQVGWAGGVDFAEIVFSGTAAFSLFVGCMISANFIGSEQSCGYTKNYAGQLPNRGYTVISKFVVTSIAQTVILLIYAIVSAVFAMILFGNNITGYDFGALLAALGLRLLLHLAINAIIIFLCNLTKSHAVAMVAGCIFGIGVTKFAYMVASMLLNAVKINFSIGDYMPDGVNSQLTVGSIGDLYVKAILVAVAFVAVFVGANYLITRRRDVK